jgi:predicted peroxiredoxin
MSDRMIFVCSHGREDPERAIVAFAAASTAAIAGLPTTVLCTLEGVWLGTSDGTDGFEKEGLPALPELFANVIDNGGEVWLCGVCTRPRNITEDQLVKGAKIVGAAKVVEEVANGAKMLNYG